MEVKICFSTCLKPDILTKIRLIGTGKVLFDVFEEEQEEEIDEDASLGGFENVNIHQ